MSESISEAQSQSLGLDIEDTTATVTATTTCTTNAQTTNTQTSVVMGKHEPVSCCRGEDQVGVLLQSLDLLTRLAKLDSAAYQHTLTSSVTKTDLGNAAVLQRQLDDLQKNWKLEETPIPRLVDSIHRLHSTCIQYQSHADKMTVENDRLQEKLRSSTKRVTKLEAGLQKLHKKNQKLKSKLQSKKSEKQSILKNVRTYVMDFQKQDMDGLATQLAAHERIVGNRTRTESQDTFDSVDMAAMYQLSDDGSSVANSVVSSVSSIPSVITDIGVATVKFAKPADDEDLVLHYPADRRVGIQFHNMQLMNSATTRKGSITADACGTRETNGGGFPTLSFNFDSLLGAGKKDEEEKKGESAFFVVGHFGFDDKLNISRPPIGARLVRVNDEEVDDGFTLQMIREIIQGYPFTLSFRVIPLTSKESEEIQKVAKETFVSRSKATNTAPAASSKAKVSVDNKTLETIPPSATNEASVSTVDDDMGDTIRAGNSRVSKDDKKERETIQNNDVHKDDTLGDEPLGGQNLRQQMESVGFKFKSLF